MSKRKARARRRPSRANVTAHRRAISDPKVAKLLKDLRRQWNSLDQVERGRRLRVLLPMGCSKHGLADDLQVAEVTVRRHVEIAELPDEAQKAVIAGSSAKKILLQKAAQKRKERTAKRLECERKTGKYSAEVADAVIEFCQANTGVSRPRIGPDQLGLFLSRATEYLTHFSRSGKPRARISTKAGIKALINRTKPDENRHENAEDQPAEWLASIVWAIAPEQEIWEEGLCKAQQRERELKEKGKNPLQMFHDAVKRSAMIADPYQRRRRF